jgi:hypothetical protein
VLAGFAIPFVAATTFSKRTLDKWWVRGVNGSVSALLLIWGIWDFVDAPYGNAEMHAILAREWRQVANEWENARSLRDAESPETLTALYRQVKAKQEHAEGLEPPNLYEVDGLRRAQAEFNHFLGKGPKPDESA